MGKKKKRFITKKNIKWKIIDTIYFLCVFIFSAKIVLIDGGAISGEESALIYGTGNLFIWIIWTLFILACLFAISGPFILLYLALRWSIKKYNRSRVTFDVYNDLEYYREKFNSISPATMSLLMDLSLESEKDLGAMKLYYELNNIYLYEKDSSIYINNPNNIELNKSDSILLNYFYDEKNRLFALREWRENVISEAINSNLIKRKSKDEKKKAGCGIFLLIHLLSLGFIFWFVMNSDELFMIFDQISPNAKDDLSFLISASTNPDYIWVTIIFILAIFALIIYFWSFIAGIIHFIVSNVVKLKDKFKRTYDGNILAEKLYGMKNFIRDFSNLDDATKKHLVLWRDFLIYAVVLEENEIILKEISSLYNVNMLEYKHYKIDSKNR